VRNFKIQYSSSYNIYFERFINVTDQVLYFNPYSGILEHLKIERDLQRIISKSKMKLDYVRCDGLYKSYCTVMSTAGLKPDSNLDLRETVCNRCKSLDKFSRNFENSKYLTLDQFLTGDLKTQVNTIMAEINIDNWMDFIFQGEFFGRVASYEFYLTYKLSSTQIPAALWPELQKEITACLTTYLIAMRILTNSNYKIVGVYNYLYGMNRAFIIAAKQLGLKTFSIQANGFLDNVHSRYLVYDADNYYWFLNSSKEWKIARDFPLGLMQVIRVLRHFKTLFEAKSVWTYSLPGKKIDSNNLRKKLGIPLDKNVYLLTTSSADEQFAFGFVGLIDLAAGNSNQMFVSNLDWIKETIEIFRVNPEKYLVIRIHPREFANKREGVNSLEGFKILQALRGLDLPENVLLNEPEDKVSLYDLVKITEFLINSTSTVGLEFAALGVPSICISPNLLVSYPPELSKTVKSVEEYRESIVVGFSHNEIDNVRLAFRWINFKYSICSTRIPRRYITLDRVFFGPFYRFVNRFTYTQFALLPAINFLYRFFNAFEKRRFSKFNTRPDFTYKPGGYSQLLLERILIKLVVRYLKKITNWT
jgi:hypothetical protein